MNNVHINLGATTAELPVADIPAKASAFDLVASTPWAILPSMLATISAIARREHEGVEAVEAKIGRPLQNTRQVTMRGDTAIIPVTGPVFRYANLFTDISGATSLEVLAQDFTAALENSAVARIILKLDSPGGQANGIAEFAQMVKASSKPVIAYVDGSAASAAYWIASAADEIVLSKTAEVGSIGAVVAIDQSRKANGVLEIVSSQSPKKRPDLNTAEGISQIQTRIDALAQVFVEDVAAYRGVSIDTVLATFGQGDMRMGQEAVDIGMADRVSTFEALLAHSQSTKGVMMTTNAKTDAPQTTVTLAAEPLTRDTLIETNAALFNAVLAEGAALERERIQSVRAQSIRGHEALIEALAFDGVTTGPQAAVQVLAAEKAMQEQAAANLKNNAPAPVAFAAAPDDAHITHETSAHETENIAKQARLLVDAAKANGKSLSYAIAVKQVIKEQSNG